MRTNSENNTSKTKKLTCVSHSISTNYGNMFVNYYNTVAYFCVTRNTFGAPLTDLSVAHSTCNRPRESNSFPGLPTIKVLIA